MKHLISFIIFLYSFVSFSQNGLWKSYFSYQSISNIVASEQSILIATNNAFIWKKNNTSLQPFHTVSGVKGDRITASGTFFRNGQNMSIIGFENGLFQLIQHETERIKTVYDIFNKSIISGSKRINHFYVHANLLFISTDFGLVTYDLDKLEFADTYYFGNNGSSKTIRQVAVLNEKIYVLTDDGLMEALLSDPNLINADAWKQIWNGNAQRLFVFQENLHFQQGNKIYLWKQNFAQQVLSLDGVLNDVKTSDKYLICTSGQYIKIFDSSLLLEKELKISDFDLKTVFTTCQFFGNQFYIGTADKGCFVANSDNGFELQNVSPDGPLRNRVFRITANNNDLWVAFGGYSGTYNPFDFENGGPNLFGISKWDGNSWKHISEENVFGARALSSFAFRQKSNEVFVGSYFSGLLQLNDDVPTKLFNHQNSGLETLTFLGPQHIDIRINTPVFDKNGDLWVTNGLIKNGLKKMNTSGQWTTYPIGSAFDKPEDNSFTSLIIDSNNTKWIGCLTDGVLAYNEKNTWLKKINFGVDNGNLPSKNVMCLALDKNEQLWIGTKAGLRVVNQVSDYLTKDVLKTNPIIILEDGLAQELMYDQYITDIEVDGANNKWISTMDSGVFLVSSNGQKTLQHFTNNNSPLPSNSVIDVAIMPNTGEVFFATPNGMVSYQGDGILASTNLENVQVFPNPLRPDDFSEVKITGLMDNAVVKITGVLGNLVFETKSQGGAVVWDTTAFGKYKVASGVYVILITDLSVGETKLKKLMIIR